MGVTYNYGAGPTYTKIASQTLGSAAASVTLSNLPQNYTDLVLVFTGAMSSADYVMVRVGSGSTDTGSNYSGVTMKINNTTFTNSASSNDTSVSGPNPLNLNNNNMIFNFSNYSNSTTYKTFLWRQNVPASSAGGDGNLSVTQGLWRSTSPIDRIHFFTYYGQTYAAGCTFTLYGIAAALTPKAEGGTITLSGTNFIHTFTSSGKFTPKTNLTADYLVVAGGGSGASQLNQSNGGGGAGGYRYLTSQSLTSGTEYTITVGAGGAGVVSGNNGNNGANSSISGSGFSTVTSSGGGAGGRGVGTGNTFQPGSSGGSGGGAGGYPANPGSPGTLAGGGAGNAGSYSPVEGFRGGRTNSVHTAGGGGGSSAVGGDAGQGAGSTAGSGGAGTANSIAGTSKTYAGGGAGSGDNNGTGGSGGGGNVNTNGTANLGGGGGGATGGGGTSGAGGSGIVIVRYSA